MQNSLFSLSLTSLPPSFKSYVPFNLLPSLRPTAFIYRRFCSEGHNVDWCGELVRSVIWNICSVETVQTEQTNRIPGSCTNAAIVKKKKKLERHRAGAADWCCADGGSIEWTANTGKCFAGGWKKDKRNILRWKVGVVHFVEKCSSGHVSSLIY